jgi:uncharacterized protein
LIFTVSDSLRDQLLKSGLVQKLKPQEKPARDKHKPQHTQNRQAQNNPAPKPAPKPQAPTEPNLAHAYALRAREEKEERERVQREADRMAREKKERKQKLLVLLEGKSLNAADADVARHFPHGNKIRRVYCTADQLVRLNKGDLAVVQLAGRYLIVERDIAVQAQTIQAESLVLLCDPNAPPEDDVPSDLVW